MREFWIVNPDAETVFVYRLSAERLYAKPQVYRADEVVRLAAVEGASIDLAQAFRK